MNLEFTGEVQQPYSGQGSPNTCHVFCGAHAIHVQLSVSDVLNDITARVQVSSYCRHVTQRLVPKLTFYTQPVWNIVSKHVLCDFSFALVLVWPPLWSSGYRSRGPGFDSRRYQIFWEVVGMERGAFSLVRIIEELLEWKSSGSGLENWY
jgi:hypothetical protein